MAAALGLRAVHQKDGQLLEPRVRGVGQGLQGLGQLPFQATPGPLRHGGGLDEQLFLDMDRPLARADGLVLARRVVEVDGLAQGGRRRGLRCPCGRRSDPAANRQATARQKANQPCSQGQDWRMEGIFHVNVAGNCKPTNQDIGPNAKDPVASAKAPGLLIRAAKAISRTAAMPKFAQPKGPAEAGRGGKWRR